MMLLLLAHWRLALTGAATVMICMLLIGVQYERHARGVADHQRDEAMQRAAAATAQTRLSELAGVAAVEAEVRAATVTARAEEVADEIHSVAGADTRLPSSVRAAWMAGVLGMRESAGAGVDLDRPRRRNASPVLSSR